MNKRYEAMFVLHSLGDTIGFRNGYWEMNHKSVMTLDIVNEFLYEFISLGGINGLDISDWKASDDTLYHIATAKSMLKYKGNINKKFILNVKNEIIKQYNFMADELNGKIFDRYPGINTVKYVSKFTEKTDASHHPYDAKSGGNGCAMKLLCIGACLYGKKRRDELIDVSIRIGKMTHNSPIGFLAGLNTALFVAFSLENIDINKWPMELLKILKSGKVKNHIDKNSIDEMSDYLTYMKHWKSYIDTRFEDNKPITAKSQANLMLRIKYYHESFVRNTPAHRMGESGYAACIMAYDSLIDSDSHWEKLVVYSAMHPGDSDTVCAIAGGLFGIHYGYSDTPEVLLNNMEFSKDLKHISQQIYEMYYKKSN